MNLTKTNRTKLIATLMLIAILIIGILSLSACEWMNFNSTEQSNLKTTKPTSVNNTNLPNTFETIQSTVELENGEAIAIIYGKDFSQDDIDFILMLHGETRNDRAICDPLMSYDLQGILTAGKNGHSILLAHFDNPYIICAYLKSDASKYEINKWGDYKFDITKYVWYKFYSSEQIVDEIDNMERTKDIYLLYDSTIKRDIVNGVEYNKNCKYYMEYKSEYTWQLTTPDMLLYFEPRFVADVLGEKKYIRYPEFGGGTLEVYVDENGAEYLYFYYGAYYENGTEYENYTQDRFGEHYEYLSQYFQILDEYVNASGRTVKSAGIKLDMLVNYLTDGR